jgi:hypothetical protein
LNLKIIWEHWVHNHTRPKHLSRRTDDAVDEEELEEVEGDEEEDNDFDDDEDEDDDFDDDEDEDEDGEEEEEEGGSVGEEEEEDRGGQQLGQAATQR